MSRLLLNYTREPIDEKLYDPKLAYSMHLAIQDDDGSFTPLNHNSGVLFAKASENEDGSLNPKSIKNPYLFTLKNSGFGIVAIRTTGDGEPDEESQGSVLFFTSENLTTYNELGLLKLGEEAIKEVCCHYDSKTDQYILKWVTSSDHWMEAWVDLPKRKLISDPFASSAYIQETIVTDIEGAIPHNTIAISEDCANWVRAKLLPPTNIGITYPKVIHIKTKEELTEYKAIAQYSDGSTATKIIDWDTSFVDFQKSGHYLLKGRIHKEHFDFPIAYNRADPCIGRWKNKYYFIATNDADNNHTLYIREADTIPELVNAKEHLILDSESHPGIGGLLWAPEFHIINGKLYIFHAATPGEFFWEESHIMELREGGNPICKEDWSAPKRIVRKDGTDICEAGKSITLDMTCFLWEGDYYVIWSQRQFLPKDLGAWLYIAKLNQSEPWKLLTDPVLLSKPEYGWANNHTFVDEGPYALFTDKHIFITFSSAAVDSSYVVGLLSIEKGKDLLTALNWKKENYPILTSRSVKGEFGTGHNAYVIDDNGDVWNTYHARPGVDAPRSSGIRRVQFDFEGYPRLDVTEEMDVKEEFRDVEVELILESSD